jgi:hypothetical protein
MTEVWIQDLATLLRVAKTPVDIHHTTVESRVAQHVHSASMDKEAGKEIHVHFRPSSAAWALSDITRHHPKSLVLTSMTLPDMRLMAHRFGLDDPMQASISPAINLEEQVSLADSSCSSAL